MGGKILPFKVAETRKAQNSDARKGGEDVGASDLARPRNNVTDISIREVTARIEKLQSDHHRLSKSQHHTSGPTSYETTRIYNFVEVVEQFNLPDSPLVRLINSQHPGCLPKAAVVHFEQMPSNPETRKVSPRLVGKTLFIPHHQFEAWITRDNINSPEKDILELLTGYLMSGSTKVN
ncbi:MAG: hypothetical protein AAFW66_04145 [Pseudomonadota bacterium]